MTILTTNHNDKEQVIRGRMYTGCLYDPAVIHKCIQVHQARSSEEAYGWELPLHDLRVLASRMANIDVCVEHECSVSVGVVRRGYIDEHGRLICEFSLYRSTADAHKNNKKNNKNRYNRTTDARIAATVDHWIKAGALRELSLQHVRDTLTPLEVSIVVSGARPNSLIQRRILDSCVPSTSGSRVVHPHGLGFKCKRRAKAQHGGTVTVMASCKSGIRLTESGENANRTVHMEHNDNLTGTFNQMQQSQQQQQQQHEKGEEEDTNDQDAVEGGTQHGMEDDNEDDEHSNISRVETTSNTDTGVLSTSQKLGNLLANHQEQQYPDKPESLSILATAIKCILQAHRNTLADKQGNNSSSIRASADVEEDQLAAATAFVAGLAGDGGRSDYISPHICIAARAAIDAIECNLRPADELTGSDSSPMVGHTTSLAAAMWIEKLCEADKRASNQSHVHELDLVAASTTELRKRIQTMFVPRPPSNDNQSIPSPPCFDVDLARALTGTFRRGIEALQQRITGNTNQNNVQEFKQSNTKNNRSNRSNNNSSSSSSSSSSNNSSSNNGVQTVPRKTRVRASITRDFTAGTKTPQSGVHTRQKHRHLRRDPFKCTENNNNNNNNRHNNRNNNRDNNRVRATANVSEGQRMPTKTTCAPPSKRTKRSKKMRASRSVVDVDGPFANLNSEDAVWMQKLFNNPKMLQMDNPGVLTLRPMHSQ
jgi:hypothetical protein